MDTSECQPLYLEIQEFYEGLNMKVEQQVPLLLVERQALNEAMEGEKAVCLLCSKSNVLLSPLILFANWLFSVDTRVTTIFQKQEDCAYQKNRQLARWELSETPIGLFSRHLIMFYPSFVVLWGSEWGCFQILRRPRMAGNKIMEMITEPYRLTRRCEVTAILILYGLPRWNINLLFCSATIISTWPK